MSQRPAQVTVRRARTTAEIAAAGRVVEAAYRALGFTDESYLGRVGDARDRADTATLLVAVDETTTPGTVLGSATYARAGEPYSEVSHPGESEFRMLGVDPSAGGRGVGAALVQACIDQARSDGAHAVAICTMDQMRAARTIYERLGFVRDPSRDWQPDPEVALLGYVLDLASVSRGATHGDQ